MIVTYLQLNFIKDKTQKDQLGQERLCNVGEQMAGIVRKDSIT